MFFVSLTFEVLQSGQVFGFLCDCVYDVWTKVVGAFIW